jgi:hypothetical protein
MEMMITVPDAIDYVNSPEDLRMRQENIVSIFNEVIPLQKDMGGRAIRRCN